MKTPADKTKENKSQAAGNAFISKYSSRDSIIKFIDTRPER